MHIKIILFSLLISSCLNNCIVAEEENKKSDYTWWQWFVKTAKKAPVIFAGGCLCIGALAHISTHIIHEDDSLKDIGLACVAIFIGGGIAANALTNKLMADPEENKEPNLLVILLQDQLETKENRLAA